MAQLSDKSIPGSRVGVKPAASENRGSARRKGRVYWATSQGGFEKAFRKARSADLLVSQSAEWPAQALLSAGRTDRNHRQAPKLLVNGRLSARTRAAYDAVFGHVVDRGVIRLLPESGLREVLGAPHRKSLFVGAMYLEEARVVVLYRGTLEPMVVPVSWFESRPGGPSPDPYDVSVIDHGQTVRLGGYEASTDAILYEHDPDFRMQARRRMREQDSSLGGSIRRLRLQKGLKQSDFPGIPPRTIGRIERGDVESPRPDTLERIAERLSVKADELGSY